jgi:hypothetical protein
VTELTKDPQAISAAIDELTKEAPVEIKTVAPSSNEVALPGGYITQEGTLVKYAEVRELNGADEEAIAKAGSIARVLNTILQRGLVKIGDKDVTKEVYDELLSGDRDAILLGIRKATFGSTADYNLVCSKCEQTSIVTIDLDKDVPVKELDNPIEDRKKTVELRNGNAVVVMPNGRAQVALLENATKTAAELNTVILEHCLLGVNGKGSLGTSTVLKLVIADRDTLVEAILADNPGPNLAAVTKTCEACGESNDTPISLVALFRL